jgi:uncharacterized RDD family membrane protein YckC
VAATERDPQMPTTSCPGCGATMLQMALRCPACSRELSDHSSLGGDGVGMPRADFGVRLLAALIDGLILLVPYLLVRFSFSPLIALAIFQLFGLVYNIGFWTTKGATPGKMAMGLGVVDMHGKELNVWRAIARYLSLIVDGLTLGLGDLLIFGDQRLALHDRISGSQVVKDWLR